MYSTIYQISKNPIKENDYIDESRSYDMGFVNHIADYMNDEIDRDDEIIDLKECLKDIAEFEGDKFTIRNKEAFFKDKYTMWIKSLKLLEQMSFETFASLEGGRCYYDLICQKNLSDGFFDYKYGTYFTDNGEDFDYATFEKFMRRTQNGDVWYIGKIYLYHW